MPQIKAFLAIVESLFLLSLIVSCLLGCRTCWWPLNSLATCVRAAAWLRGVVWPRCVHVPLRTCTRMFSCCTSWLYVLSGYDIFSCSSHWLPVFGRRSGVLSGCIAHNQPSFFLSLFVSFTFHVLHLLHGFYTQPQSIFGFLFHLDAQNGAVLKLLSFLFFLIEKKTLHVITV